MSVEAIDLFVEIGRDGEPFYESVLVEHLGGLKYRVLASPGMLEGCAAGDEIELLAEDRTRFRLSKRGGNVCIQFFVEGDHAACASELTARIEALDGRLDGETAGLLVFTVPVSAGFPAIEAVFYDAEKRYAGCSWMFGNVYDPVDGETPLNWWLDDSVGT